MKTRMLGDPTAHPSPSPNLLIMGAPWAFGTGVLGDSPKVTGLRAAGWQNKDLNPGPLTTGSGLFVHPLPLFAFLRSPMSSLQ